MRNKIINELENSFDDLTCGDTGAVADRILKLLAYCTTCIHIHVCGCKENNTGECPHWASRTLDLTGADGCKASVEVKK